MEVSAGAAAEARVTGARIFGCRQRCEERHTATPEGVVSVTILCRKNASRSPQLSTQQIRWGVQTV